MEKLIVKNSAGNDIHVYVYDQVVAPVKGVVHLIHGVAEHVARYGLFAAFLNKNGYIAVGCDFLGHGLSTDTNAYVHYADKHGDETRLRVGHARPGLHQGALSDPPFSSSATAWAPSSPGSR
ncbi:MAG: alpha/beta hydrolase [Bacillus subtilis]|nr:alpha/beta hydrolase [Bacillus subtilis]